MKIGVLTSSRADYSVYYPLLKKLQDDPFFELSIIAFGTHLSPYHGETVSLIEADGFNVSHKISSIIIGDSPETIASSIGQTMIKFSSLWAQEKFDFVLALGDRFEMFAAVSALLPFNGKVVHLHGGETTTGAIDNAYRHSISHMSYLHFVSTEAYKLRLSGILGSNENIVISGALSIESLANQEIMSKEALSADLGLDFTKPVILFTFHPETAQFEANKNHITEILTAFDELKQFQILITMPNVDTMGNLIRSAILKYAESNDQITIKESLGMKRYFSAMRHAALMLGNSSSGFVEASYFPTKVVNLGHRQDGRLITPNIINSAITKADILQSVYRIYNSPPTGPINVYGTGQASEIIVQTLKKLK